MSSSSLSTKSLLTSFTNHSPKPKIPCSDENKITQQIIYLSWQSQINDLRLSQPLSSKFISLLNSNDLPNIIVLGKSGSGKGTLSKMLASRYKYEHISIGDMHRHENQRGTLLGLRIRHLVQQNMIVSQEMALLTFEMLNHLFDKLIQQKKTFILDNFPNNLLHVPYILDILMKFNLKKKTIIIVPLISDKKSLHRLVNRRVCSSYACGKSYNLITAPPRISGQCDDCHSNLGIRIDDTREIIFNKRLPYYRNNILPVIQALSTHIDVYAINNIFALLNNHLYLDFRNY